MVHAAPGAESLLYPTPTPTKHKRLREIIASGETAMAPGAFNATCAKMVEGLGYPLVYVSGAGLSNGVGGYPDIGMMTQTEFAEQAGYIARATSLPVIADADTGFGEAIQVYRTVQEYERAGISALHLEDQVFPKRCGHLQGKTLLDPEAMAEKITAACEARMDKDFMVIARVDSFAIYGFSDAVARAHRYLDAGADMIFIEALNTPELFRGYAQEVKAPLLANMTEFGKTPYLTIQEFQDFGYNVVIYPMTAFRIMMKAVWDGLEHLRQQGTQRELEPQMATRQQLYDLLQYPAYERMDASLVRAGRGSQLVEE